MRVLRGVGRAVLQFLVAVVTMAAAVLVVYEGVKFAVFVTLGDWRSAAVRLGFLLLGLVVVLAVLGRLMKRSSSGMTAGPGQ